MRSVCTRVIIDDQLVLGRIVWWVITRAVGAVRVNLADKELSAICDFVCYIGVHRMFTEQLNGEVFTRFLLTFSTILGLEKGQKCNYCKSHFTIEHDHISEDSSVRSVRSHSKELMSYRRGLRRVPRGTHIGGSPAGISIILYYTPNDILVPFVDGAVLLMEGSM